MAYHAASHSVIAWTRDAAACDWIRAFAFDADSPIAMRRSTADFALCQATTRASALDATVGDVDATASAYSSDLPSARRANLNLNSSAAGSAAAVSGVMRAEAWLASHQRRY